VTHSSKLLNSSAFFSPCTSCTILPPMRSTKESAWEPHRGRRPPANVFLVLRSTEAKVENGRGERCVSTTFRKTSIKCCAPPAPPEAITGMRTDCAITLVRAQSSLLPCRHDPSTVSRISPAPRSSASFAHETASFPVGTRPPPLQASKPFSVPFASMATITACDPKRCAMQVMSDESARAAELMLTLSAPASKMASASASVRTPPPTVKGNKQFLRGAPDVSTRVARFSWVAVMSSRTTSSAPAAL